MASLAYAGCGVDFSFVLGLGRFDQFQTFILIDSQPESEFGNQSCLIDGKKTDGFQRPGFLPTFLKKGNSLGFVARHDTGLKLYHLYHPKLMITVKLYFSRPLPLLFPPRQLISDLQQCSALCVAGFLPDKTFSHWIPTVKQVFTNTTTVLGVDDEEEKNSIVPLLKTLPWSVLHVPDDLKPLVYSSSRHFEQHHRSALSFSTFTSLRHALKNGLKKHLC